MILDIRVATDTPATGLLAAARHLGGFEPLTLTPALLILLANTWLLVFGPSFCSRLRPVRYGLRRLGPSVVPARHNVRPDGL